MQVYPGMQTSSGSGSRLAFGDVQLGHDPVAHAPMFSRFELYSSEIDVKFMHMSQKNRSPQLTAIIPSVVIRPSRRHGRTTQRYSTTTVAIGTAIWIATLSA